MRIELWVLLPLLILAACFVVYMVVRTILFSLHQRDIRAKAVEVRDLVARGMLDSEYAQRRLAELLDEAKAMR